MVILFGGKKLMSAVGGHFLGGRGGRGGGGVKEQKKSYSRCC